MVDEYVEETILLSIRPEFAHAILSGKKAVEFRRVVAKRPVRRVVIYSTAPDSEIIGYFDVVRIEEASPKRLWNLFKHVAGIGRSRLMNYFSGRSTGFALVVGTVYALADPVPIRVLGDTVLPPQSFRYIATTDWDTFASSVVCQGERICAA